MKFDLTKSLKAWRVKTSDRVKLQHVYVTFAIASIIVAGLVGLVDYTTGQRLVSLGLLSLGVYLINMIVWALVDGLLLMRLDRQDVTHKASNKSSVKTTSTAKSRSTKK